VVYKVQLLWAALVSIKLHLKTEIVADKASSRYRESYKIELLPWRECQMHLWMRRCSTEKFNVSWRRDTRI
jgi:hypothetical protein